MDSTLKTVEQTISRYGMFQSDDSVLVGLSGGPDSVALLHILLELAPEYSINIGVAHLNHSLRGASSDNDAEFVRQLAMNLNLPYYIRKEDVRKYQIVNKLSLEEAARSVRYAFFQDVAEKNRFNKIALGHHADDNAELILMYLLRGSGAVGVSGISPKRDFQGIKILRPLIHLTRAEVNDFLNKKGLSFVSDESNTDTKYLRNRIRHYLLPELKASYNPGLTEALNRFSSIMRSEEEWIDKEIIEPVFKDTVVSQNNNKIIILYEKIEKLHLAAKRRIIRKAIASVKGNLRRIAYVHTEAVIALLAGKKGGVLDLPDGIRVEWNYEKSEVRIFKTEDRMHNSDFRIIHPDSFEYSITEVGPLFIKESGIYLNIEKIETADYPVQIGKSDENNKNYELFDMDTLSFPLKVRNIRPGDRFTPLGMTGTQKLKKYFINNKIPVSERSRSFVLLSREKIMWVVGHRIDDSVKITPSTRNVLKVEIKK